MSAARSDVRARIDPETKAPVAQVDGAVGERGPEAQRRLAQTDRLDELVRVAPREVLAAAAQLTAPGGIAM